MKHIKRLVGATAPNRSDNEKDAKDESPPKYHTVNQYYPSAPAEKEVIAEDSIESIDLNLDIFVQVTGRTTVDKNVAVSHLPDVIRDYRGLICQTELFKLGMCLGLDKAVVSGPCMGGDRVFTVRINKRRSNNLLSAGHKGSLGLRTESCGMNTKYSWVFKMSWKQTYMKGIEIDLLISKPGRNLFKEVELSMKTIDKVLVVGS